MPQTGRPPRSLSFAAFLFFALSLALIAVATLTPQGGARERSPVASEPNSPHERSPVTSEPVHRTGDLVANVILFIPFGLAAGLLHRYRRAGRLQQSTLSAIATVAAAGAALSAAIELTQLSGVVAGRYASLADIIANTGGSLVGAALAANASFLLFPSRDEGRRLALSWMALLVPFLLLSQYATGRPITGTVKEGDIVKPELSSLPFTTGYGWFEGQVPGATVNGVALSHRGTGALIVEAPSIRDEAITLTVLSSDRRQGFVPLAFIHTPGLDATHTMIGQRGSEFALRVATRADRWGLRLPDLTVPNPVPTADTLGASVAPVERTLRAGITGRHWQLEAAASGSVIRASYVSGFWSAWMFAAPLHDLNGFTARVGTILFLLCLFLPPVYWWMRRWSAH